MQLAPNVRQSLVHGGNAGRLLSSCAGIPTGSSSDSLEQRAGQWIASSVVRQSFREHFRARSILFFFHAVGDGLSSEPLLANPPHEDEADHGGLPAEVNHEAAQLHEWRYVAV